MCQLSQQSLQSATSHSRQPLEAKCFRWTFWTSGRSRILFCSLEEQLAHHARFCLFTFVCTSRWTARGTAGRCGRGFRGDESVSAGSGFFGFLGFFAGGWLAGAAAGAGRFGGIGGIWAKVKRP